MALSCLIYDLQSKIGAMKKLTLSCKICFLRASAFLSIDSSFPRFSSLPNSVASAFLEPKLIDDANIVSYAKDNSQKSD